MNKIAITLFLSFTSVSAFAQQKEIAVIKIADTANYNKKKVKTVMPTFPGDIGTYLMKNVKLTKQVKGDEEVRFLIGVDGRLSQFTVVKSLGAVIDSPVIQALRIMPKWKPATENGKKVAMWYNLPIDMN